MKKILLILFFVCRSLIAQEAKVTPLMSKELTDFPGKEGLMITVEYPSGISDPIHRHNAQATYYGIKVTERALVPENSARLGKMRFDEWLAQPVSV